MEETLKKAIGEVISTLRKEKGLSQEKLCNKINMDRSYFSELENGMWMPTLLIIFKIAYGLNTTPEEMIRLISMKCPPLSDAVFE